MNFLTRLCETLGQLDFHLAAFHTHGAELSPMDNDLLARQQADLTEYHCMVDTETSGLIS